MGKNIIFAQDMRRYRMHAIICTGLDLTIAIKLQSPKANSDSWSQDLFSQLPMVLISCLVTKFLTYRNSSEILHCCVCIAHALLC